MVKPVTPPMESVLTVVLLAIEEICVHKVDGQDINISSSFYHYRIYYKACCQKEYQMFFISFSFNSYSIKMIF